MYARIDWTKPRVESLAIIGDKFQMYVPGSGQAWTGKVNKGPKGVPKGAFDFLGMSRAELKANYAHEIAGPETIEGGFVTTHLVLTPKTAMDYKKADLWVDQNGMVRMARITSKNNDTSTVLLYDFDKNKKVDASAFAIKFPKGVKPKPV
jgi:outer membrane lipoprotein-sorting protein